MATKHTDECLSKAHDDEPIFVLRAQDRFAPLMVETWARLAEAVNCPVPKVDEAIRLADQMRDWQESNGSKYPD